MEDVEAVLDSVSRTAIRLLNAAPGTTKVRVQSGAACIEIERDVPAGQPAATVTLEAAPEPVAVEQGNLEYICAPMVGTFYHAQGPGEPPMVKPGDLVEPGQHVGILEAMKLMNPVEAGKRGRVLEILVADATPVEYDQRLIVLEMVDEG